MHSRLPAASWLNLALTCLITGLLCDGAAAAVVQTAKQAAQDSKTATRNKAAEPADQKAAAKSGSGQKKADDKQGTTGTKPTATKPPARIVSFSGGRTRLNVRHWPLIGDPDATYVFVEMFDYTCPHCRNTHRALDGAFERLNNDLAVVVLPVPLDARCNSSVRRTNSQHAEACAVATIAVAVWRCSPSRFHSFHDWMFASSRSRTAREARAYGEKLVGKEKLDAEMAKPYAKQYIKKHVQLYQRAGAGTVPKLMFPRATLAGAITSPTTMVRTIERHLGSGSRSR